MAPTLGAPSQDFVPIQGIRDGIVILKDGSLRAVLLASSVNLALKSENEQKATISSFQNFFNGLEFSIQIAIQSRRLDIRPYLLTLEERLETQKEDLLRVQTREYIEFIKAFTEQVNIMRKHFFVLIPYARPALSTPSAGGFLDKILPSKSQQGSAPTHEKFEESRSQLEQRIAVVQGGLSQVGVRTVQLGSQEIIELFHETFNPGDTQKAIKVEGDL